MSTDMTPESIADLIRRDAGNDQVACRTASLDQFGCEANLSYGWVFGEEAADHVASADEDDEEVELGGISLGSALEVYDSAEGEEPIGYTPIPAASHRRVTIERPAIGMQAGMRTTYVWPEGGW